MTPRHSLVYLGLLASMALACERSPDDSIDAGALDGGPVDAGDAGPPDAGHPDSGPHDAGIADSGPVDAGPVDAGPIDAGAVDAGPGDGGIDAGIASCLQDGQSYPPRAANPADPTQCCKGGTGPGASGTWVQRLQATDYQVGATPYGIAAADFSGSGNLGLAVIVKSQNHQLVRLEPGDGGYADAGLYPITPLTSGSTDYYPCDLATPDLNGDGRADVVVTNCDDLSFEVFLSQADGTLLGTTYPLSGDPIRVKVADVDGDGVLDLVVALYGDNQVAVVKGKSGEGFGPPTLIGVGLQPDGLFFGDFDGDGVGDLAVTNQNDNDIEILRGTPDGGFTSIGTYPGSDSGGGILDWIAGGDFDGDGNLDLIASNYAANEAVLLLGKGDGTFGTPNFLVFSDPLFPSSAAFADLDGDGQPEIVVAGQNTNTIEAFQWDGAAQTLQPWFSVPSSAAPLALIAIPHRGSVTFDLAYAGGQDLNDTITVLTNGCP